MMSDAIRKASVQGLFYPRECTKHLKLSSKLLDYSTSATVNKDTSSVAGYMSAMFY